MYHLILERIESDLLSGRICVDSRYAVVVKKMHAASRFITDEDSQTPVICWR